MPSNPTRPSTATVIATSWGLSVADTVVRRYTNAATRDADLTGHVAADLLGQIVVLTGTGEVLQYVGPVLGWQKPWNCAWGLIGPPQTFAGDIDAAAGAGNNVMMVAGTTTLGRRLLVAATLTVNGEGPGYFQTGPLLTGICRVPTGYTNDTRTYSLSNIANSTATGTVTVNCAAISIGVRGSQGACSLALTDVGPAANPTAIVAGPDGTPTVDVDRLDPEYRPLWVPGE